MSISNNFIIEINIIKYFKAKSNLADCQIQLKVLLILGNTLEYFKLILLSSFVWFDNL